MRQVHARQLAVIAMKTLTHSPRVSAVCLLLWSLTTAAQTPPTLWVYHDGTMKWGGDWSFAATADYRDREGKPASGRYDVAVKGQWNGGWQPYISVNCQNTDAACLDTRPYKYLIMSLKPTVAGQTWGVFFHAARDTDDGVLASVTDYGPMPEVGKWASYKIPLSAFKLTNPTILKFFIQGGPGGAGLWYADDVGFTAE
jgi:hypothetical protein